MPDMTAPASPDIIIHLLAGGPATLATLMHAVPEACQRWSDAADRWSIHQVVAHLAQIEESDRGWIPRLRHLLDGMDGPLPRVDAHRRLPAYAHLPMPELLTRFAAARRTGIGHLASWRLDDGAMRRTGTHPDRGTVSVGNLLCTWAMHDIDHIAQICRILGRHHAGQVGPLAEYLRICRDPA